MSRFPLIPADDVFDPVVRRVYREIEQELGFGIVPNVFRAMASRPGLLEANWALFKSTVLQGSLPRTLKEMVGVVVSAAHASDYARLVHLHSLGVQGIADEVLRALGDGRVESEGLTLATTSVLRFAKRAAERPAAMTDADFDELRRAGLSSDEALEVVATIQLFTAVNAFTDVAGVEIDSI